MKKVYIVRGSEDGNIGVFGNKKAAYACGMSYVLENGRILNKVYTQSYQYLCKHDVCTIHGSGRIVAEIETFYLESKRGV